MYKDTIISGFISAVVISDCKDTYFPCITIVLNTCQQIIMCSCEFLYIFCLQYYNMHIFLKV